MSSGEKTEKPTPKKLREARREGKVPRSADFTGTMVMIAAAAALVITMDSMVAELLSFTRRSIDLAFAPEPDSGHLAGHLLAAVRTVAIVLGPILATGFVIAAFISYLQVGPVFTHQTVVPDGNRLNPAEGWKRLVSKDRLVDLAKNLVRLSVMIGIATLVVADALTAVLRIPRATLAEATSILGTAAYDQAKYLLLALVAFAIVDLLWQRHTHTRDLKMSKQEVKEEHKQSEGDPQVKSKRRQMHRDLLRGAGLNQVADADAVVVNPTHVAAAIRYREAEMTAPRVVARGRGEIARKIKRLARRKGVPIVREVALARSLVELALDEEIPEDLYDAVAEVLHFVYTLKEQR
jgi:flagellar biosynthetic protein FlhB